MNNSAASLKTLMNLTNSSGLHPKGTAVLVRPEVTELKTSRIVIPETVSDRNKMIETVCTVVEIGECAWLDEPVPRAQVGDRVMISKYSGNLCLGPKDGKTYRMVNCGDIYCVVED